MPETEKQKRNTKNDAIAEDTLVKKHYVEDDIEHLFVEQQHDGEQYEKMYELVEDGLERVLFKVAVLTLIAAIMTAIVSYIFSQLPGDIYASHILNEMFLIYDDVMFKSGISKDMGLHTISPLPAVVLVMYILILMIVYFVQHPQQKQIEKYIRYGIFVTLQLYLALATISYVHDIMYIKDRLNAYFEKDKVGLIYEPNDEHNGSLHGLDGSQQYFGCCGYKKKEEWFKAFPTKYNKTWPLSCCDQEKSGIACYGPVEETVVYVKPAADGETSDEKPIDPPVKRLHSANCSSSEEKMVMVLACFVVTLIIIYLLAVTWAVSSYHKISAIATEYKIVIKEKPIYTDAL